MTKQSFLFALFLFSTGWATALSAQTVGGQVYNPFFSTSGSVITSSTGAQWVLTSSNNSRTNLFNGNTGRLHVGTVQAIGGELDGEVANDVVLKLAEDGRFDLESFTEFSVTPEQECTETEVLAAIPALSIDLTVAEAEQLIGCFAKLSIGPTSLESGRTVSANWYGIDGIPNATSGVASNTWIGSTGSSGVVVSGSVIGVGSVSPFPRISLNFLEGEPVSYSYTEGGESGFCDPDQWLASLQQISPAATYADMVLLLGCEGALAETTVFAQETETTYNWVWAETNQLGTLSTTGNWEAVDITFTNGEFKSLRYSGMVRNSGVSSCAASDLTVAYELMREGYGESLTASLVPCAPNAVSTTIVDGVTTSRYSWQTSITSGSIFKSLNRSIVVTAIDGVTEQIVLHRF